MQEHDIPAYDYHDRRMQDINAAVRVSHKLLDERAMQSQAG